MIQKPAGYDSVAAYTGDFEAAPIGGQVCVIKAAQPRKDRNGKDWLVLCLDIAQGQEQSGYYQNLFDRRKTDNPDAKWPNGALYWINLSGDERAMSFTKGAFTCIEESNSGYAWNWDERTLRNKLVGIVFGQEEYENQMGEVKLSTKARFIRSVEAVKKGIPAPDVKPLRGRAGTSYRPGASTSSPLTANATEIDEDLPF